MLRFVISVSIGVTLTLLSTFVGERQATAVYPEIMGCEAGCSVVATGWPLIFVQDYTGMSVVNKADILEVYIGADRLDWAAFLLDVAFWGTLTAATILLIGRSLGRPQIENGRNDR